MEYLPYVTHARVCMHTLCFHVVVWSADHIEQGWSHSSYQGGAKKPRAWNNGKKNCIRYRSIPIV